MKHTHILMYFSRSWTPSLGLDNYTAVVVPYSFISNLEVFAESPVLYFQIFSPFKTTTTPAVYSVFTSHSCAPKVVFCCDRTIKATAVFYVLPVWMGILPAVPTGKRILAGEYRG